MPHGEDLKSVLCALDVVYRRIIPSFACVSAFESGSQTLIMAKFRYDLQFLQNVQRFKMIFKKIGYDFFEH